MEKYDYDEVNSRLQNGEPLTEEFQLKVWLANQGLIFDVIKKKLYKRSISYEQMEELKQYAKEEFYQLIGKYDPKTGVPPNAYFRKKLGYKIQDEIRNLLNQNSSEKTGVEDWQGSYEDDSSEELDYEEKRRQNNELVKEIEGKIRAAKKTTIKEKLDLQILVYMEFLGAYDGVQKSFKQIKDIVEEQFPGQTIRNSEINRIISNFTSILYDDKNSKYKSIEESFIPTRKIQSRDLALMNYIAEQNKKEGDPRQYPTRDDILQDDKMQQIFGCVDTINKSIKRLREIKHCQIEIKQQRKNGSHGGGGYWLRNPEETLSLSNQDLFIIGLIDNMIKLYGIIHLSKQFDSIKEKILEEAGAVSFEVTKNEPVSFMFTPSQIESLLNPVSEEVFESIFTATRNHLYLDFSYLEKDKITDVHLKPYHLIFYDNIWFLLGAEENDSGDEIFSWYSSRKIQNIYRKKKEKFVLNPKFNIDNYMPFSPDKVR